MSKLNSGLLALLVGATSYLAYGFSQIKTQVVVNYNPVTREELYLRGCNDSARGLWKVLYKGISKKETKTLTDMCGRFLEIELQLRTRDYKDSSFETK